MVFQNYALYPHMTVYGNMAFALKLRKIPCPIYENVEDIKGILEQIKTLRNEVKKQVTLIPYILKTVKKCILT
jgi:ABC-type sugar transport system ATPase subunit